MSDADTVDRLQVEARLRLAAAPHRPPRREALLLLARVLGRSEAQLLARPEAAVTPAEAARFRDLVERRAAGEPVAYLVGEREFYGRPFTVDRRVLIPRPESEHLVEAALALELPPAPRILDLGTGSGCLAVTLACELPAARLVATDLTPGALAVAARNARRHGAGSRVRLVAADLATALDAGGFDLVVSNPPYIGADERPVLSPEITGHEPAAALFAPGGGLAVIARLLDELAPLSPATPLLFEIGAGQQPAVERLAAGSPFRLERVVADYAGIPRVVVGRRR